MRWMLGIVVLLSVAIPQAAVAQTAKTDSSTIPAISSWQAVPRLQVFSVPAEVPARADETPRFLSLPDFPTDRGTFATLETNERNAASTAVPSGDRSVLKKAGSEAAFRPAWESRKPPTRLWRTLLIVQHGAAVFDAWSTRDAIQNGGAHELNPFFRPFAGSGAIYAATQVESGLFDYLGRWMMKSKRGWIRRLWWIPQVAGTAGSLFSGARNLAIAQGRPTSLVP